jgi:hypothetical protein
MEENYTDTINAIKRFVYDKVPAGAEQSLKHFEERTGDYLSLEFHRPCGRVTLGIEIVCRWDSSTVDERGDHYMTCFLKVQPSWPSYGSVDLDQASGFLTLLSEVTTFGKALAIAFDKPIIKLMETAEEAVKRKQMNAQERGPESECTLDVFGDSRAKSRPRAKISFRR